MNNIDDRLTRQLAKAQGLTKLIGDAPAFRAAIDIVETAAKSDASVLIAGAGTGKELIARALHYLSVRAPFPFVAVNCGSLTETLLADELFGHERGAFTDAHQPRLGLVAHADRGTLFLDEVDALTPRGQVALLRLLQDRSSRPVRSEPRAIVRRAVPERDQFAAARSDRPGDVPRRSLLPVERLLDRAAADARPRRRRHPAGLENRLYRVEIHKGGTVDGVGRAQFKWSRDNASLAARVLSITSVPIGKSLITVPSTGRDAWMRFEHGDHVELLDDDVEWAMRESGHGGDIATILSVNHATGEILIDQDLSAFTITAARHPRIRRWDIASALEPPARNTTTARRSRSRGDYRHVRPDRRRHAPRRRLHRVRGADRRRHDRGRRPITGELQNS